MLKARRTILLFVKLIKAEENDIENAKCLKDDEKKLLQYCKGTVNFHLQSSPCKNA